MPIPDYVYRDLMPPQTGMLAEIIAGLSSPRKQILPKYFYDARGCELFERICGLPEYYPTRTELAIMRAHAPQMGAMLGGGSALFEIGCGNSEKTRLLLSAAQPAVFIPIDIAPEQLSASCESLRLSFPGIAMIALRADFGEPVALPREDVPPARRRVLYFPGSTIGNFTPAEALAFLRRWAPVLGAGGGALIGVDVKKSPAALNAAYNDSQGVTAAFNLNLLTRLNRELGADFDEEAYRHRAFYDSDHGRIEMHIESLRDQRVTIAGHAFSFAAGETIHTENSYKYSTTEFLALVREGGFEPVQCWMDEEKLFSVHYLTLPR